MNDDGSPREGMVASTVLVTIGMLLIMTVLQIILAASPCSAELIDRVVAYVDDHAITYSEFRNRYEKLKKAVPDITEDEAINSMINTLLLLEEARKMRLEAASEDDLIKEYIDIRIKSRIVIKEEQTTEYYNHHKKEFEGRDYMSVRDEIEKYLQELETNKQLKGHLEELRKQSNIVVQLKDR